MPQHTSTPTAGGTVSPINYQSALPSIFDVGKYLAGSRSTEETRTTGDTDALSRILSTLDPVALEALVANLFSQGAAQVPGLTAQYANATGSRVNNNSMLGQSLAQLNQTLAQSISQAVVQQQGLQVQAAGKIADTNRLQTATKATKPGSLGRTLAPTVAGFALNRVGKAKDAPLEGSINIDNSAQFGMAPEFPQVGDLGAFNEGPVVGFNGIDTASAVFGGFDSSLFDFGAGAASFADTVGDLGAISDISDYTDEAGSFFDFFGFADGGRVNKRPMGYADGGRVVRNRPNFGPQVPLDTTQALRLASQAHVARKKAAVSEGDAEGNVADSSGATAAAVAGGPGVFANVSPFTAAAFPFAPFQTVANQLAIAFLTALFAPPATTVAETISPESVVTPAPMPPAISVDPDTGVPVTSMPPAPDPFGPEGPFGIDTGFDAPDPAGEAPAPSDAATDAGAAGGAGDAAAFSDGGRVKSKNRATDAVNINATVDEYVLPVDTVQALGGPKFLNAIVAATHTPIRGGTRG